MLTKEQVLEAIRGGRKSPIAYVDSRDYARLTDYFPVEEWGALGFSLKEGAVSPPAKDWTRENILIELASDLDFGFEKALNKRGISAGLMFEVVKMWMWVLEDDLQNHDDYANYGLPLFKAVALKYGLPNPIGDDSGVEDKYDERGS